MAVDLTVTLNPTNGTIPLPPFSSSRITYSQTNEGGGNPGIILVTTSEFTLSFGSVTPGPVLLYNLDDTNYVEWGVATGVYPFRLFPKKTTSNKGIPAVITFETGTIYLKANTATCQVLVLGYNK